MEIDGEKLKRMRLDRFYSMRELARMAGMTHETIMEIEKGERPKSRLDTIRKLAQALDVEPRELLKEGRDGRG